MRWADVYVCMLADGVALRNRCPQGQADPRAAIAGGASGVTMARAGPHPRRARHSGQRARGTVRRRRGKRRFTAYKTSKRLAERFCREKVTSLLAYRRNRPMSQPDPGYLDRLIRQYA